MNQWFSLSLVVPQSLVDPLSNFLIEMGATGIEEMEMDSQQERIKAYFPWNVKEKALHQSLRRYLTSLQVFYPELSWIDIERERVLEQDWSEHWKQFFKPFRVGRRFVMKPPWAPWRLHKDDLLIEIHPSMAFGTGTHATTQLCLKAMEKRLKKKGLSVLDVGTGSGILSIAASRLGASEVWGIDIDQGAVDNAKENVVRNGVSEKVRIQRARIGQIRKRFDRVLANLDNNTLRKIRSALIRHLKPEGVLILSGVLKTEEEKLRQYYLETGLLTWIETMQQEEWVCLTFQKR